VEETILSRAELVFNLFEGFEAWPDTEWLFAKALRSAGCPFTGASSETLALCLNKALTKRLLMAHGIPTPDFQLLHSVDVEQFTLGFPAIVKPLKEDASHGIDSQSVVHDMRSLKTQVSAICDRYGGPALVESFLSGREFSVSILGGPTPQVLPISELTFSQETPGPRIVTFAAKWLSEDPEYLSCTPVCPAQVPEGMQNEIQELVRRSHMAVGSPPYARVDLRTDSQGRLHVLEINPNPDISPHAGMALQAEAAGLGYRALIESITSLALKENRVDSRHIASHAT
jgi:D-alanine-D-alanine ligase